DDGLAAQVATDLGQGLLHRPCAIGSGAHGSHSRPRFNQWTMTPVETDVVTPASSSMTTPNDSIGVSRGISRWLSTTSRGRSARVRSLRTGRASADVRMTGG